VPWDLAFLVMRVMASQSQSQHRMVKIAGLTAAMAAVGAAAGLALDALILFRFGAGSQTDAYFAALVIPALLNGFVSIQGPKILVPVFSILFHEQEEHAWALLRNLLTIGGLAFAVATLAGVALAGIVMPLQVPGLAPDAVGLTVRLSRIAFLLVWIQGIGSILQAVLYARQSYLVSAAPKLIINIVAIAVVFASGPNRLGVEVVAWGVVLGSLAQAGLSWVVLAANGFRYRWTLEPADPRLRSMLLSFSYPLLGHVLGESGTIVQSVVASFLGSGSLTLVQYASRIIGAVGGILLGSVVQVTLPMVATHAAANDVQRQRGTLLEAIKILGLVAVPLGIWLAFTAESLVLLLFQRGQFSAADAITIAIIIRAMVPYFLLARFVSVTQTLFYANADFRTPFVSTAIFALANAILAIVLVQSLGAPGIGVAISIASVCNAVYMVFKVNGDFGPVGWAGIGPFALRLACSSALAALGFAVGLGLPSVISVAGTLARVLAVAIPSVLGFSLFIVAVVLLGWSEIRPMAPATSRVAS